MYEQKGDTSDPTTGESGRRLLGIASGIVAGIVIVEVLWEISVSYWIDGWPSRASFGGHVGGPQCSVFWPRAGRCDRRNPASTPRAPVTARGIVADEGRAREIGARAGTIRKSPRRTTKEHD